LAEFDTIDQFQIALARESVRRHNHV